MTAPALVQKLWNYCNILPPSPRLRRTGRDDGLSYGDYVEQLTYLLFLKMADEQSKPPTANLQRAARLWPSILQRAFEGEFSLAPLQKIPDEEARPPPRVGPRLSHATR